MKRTQLSRFLNCYLFILFFACFFFSIYSCRKTEISKPNNPSTEANAGRFFSGHPSSDPNIIAVQNFVQEQQNQYHFINDLTGRVGFPYWDKSFIYKGIKAATLTGKAQDDQDFVIAYVPFVRDSQQNTNACLIIKMSVTDTSYRMLYDWQYANFGFNNVADTVWNAKNVFQLFTSFDNKIFNRTQFKITDGRIFDAQKNDTLLVTMKDSANGSKIAPNGDDDIVLETCYTYPKKLGFRSSNSSSASDDESEPICVYTVVSTGAGDGSTNSGTGSTGTTAGGGSGGGTVFSNPCPSGPQEKVNANIASGCGTAPGWQATPSPDETDVNGYYYSRLSELALALANDPFAITPCDKLQPLDDDGNGYGLMYKRIAQYVVPSDVLTRLQNIAQIAPSSIFDLFTLQTLASGAGSAVNCDYFPVKFSLPPGKTPSDIIEYFRLNMTSFVDQPNPGVTFTPYAQGNFNDAAQFNLPFEQSLGALVHIHMTNDGSVVESGYYRGVINNIEKDRFTFTTITSPLDYAHPVAGNREFGIFGNPSTGYTFYTMGVDRLADPGFVVGNLIFNGFRQADLLWSDMQINMAAYINALGGIAVVQTPVKTRPDWDDVKDYLLGFIDFATLKLRLGC